MWWRRHHSRAQPCLVYEVVPGCQTHPTYRSLAHCPRYPRHPPEAVGDRLKYHYFARHCSPVLLSSRLLAENDTARLWSHFKTDGWCHLFCSQSSKVHHVSYTVYTCPACMYVHTSVHAVCIPPRSLVLRARGWPEVLTYCTGLLTYMHAAKPLY